MSYGCSLLIKTHSCLKMEHYVSNDFRIANSKLSPDADVFVPRSAIPLQSPYSEYEMRQHSSRSRKMTILQNGAGKVPYHHFPVSYSPEKMRAITPPLLPSALRPSFLLDNSQASDEKTGKLKASSNDNSFSNSCILLSEGFSEDVVCDERRINCDGVKQSSEKVCHFRSCNDLSGKLENRISSCHHKCSNTSDVWEDDDCNESSIQISGNAIAHSSYERLEHEDDRHMNRIELAHIKKYLEHDDFVQSKKCLNMASFSNVQGMNSVYIKNTVSTEINPNQCAENLTNALSLDLSQFHISEHSVCKKRMKERIVNSNKKSIKSLASNDCQSLGKHNEYKDNKSTSAYNRSTVDSRRDFERFSPLEAHEGKSVVQSPLRKSLSEKCGGGKNVSRLRTDESYLQRMQSHERVEKTRDEEMSLLSHDDYTRTFKGFQGPTEKKECITGHKKRKKSESQRKKEYKDRLKLLPSIQGKVLTVSQDFYCLVADSNSECNVLKRKAGEQKMSFELEDFPVLCENTPKNSALTALNTLNEIYDSSYPSDSEWSDVACYDYSSDINVKSGREYNEDFPSLGCQSNPCVPGLEAYGSVRQKENVRKLSKDISAVGSEIESKFITRQKKSKTQTKIQLNLLSVLKKQEVPKSKHHYERFPNSERHRLKAKPVVVNILDSSAPQRRRGKEREKPPAKKPTAMKKIILKERKDKRDLNENCKKVAESSTIISHALNSDVEINNSLHNRRFREYCNQLVSSEINDVATKLIQDLIRFHDRVYKKDPIKAKMRRRLVVGLREVTKHLKLKRIKCIILAPNLESINSSGGLNDAINLVISLAQEQGIPCVFALGRKALGRVCLKKVPVSCVGVFNYDGSETNFKRLCELAAVGHNEYESTKQELILESLVQMKRP